jgi:hypothetical protein
MGPLNEALRTGRRIREIEQQLAAGTHDDRERAALGNEHQQLIAQQQDQMIEAADAGFSWDTIRFALQIHGQGANREPGDPRPTPAEQLALDSARR